MAFLTDVGLDIILQDLTSEVNDGVAIGFGLYSGGTLDVYIDAPEFSAAPKFSAAWDPAVESTCPFASWYGFLWSGVSPRPCEAQKFGFESPL